MMRTGKGAATEAAMTPSWLASLISDLDSSPTLQALFFVLVILARFSLDRWERQRQISRHRRTRRHQSG